MVWQDLHRFPSGEGVEHSGRLGDGEQAGQAASLLVGQAGRQHLAFPFPFPLGGCPLNLYSSSVVRRQTGAGMTATLETLVLVHSGMFPIPSLLILKGLPSLVLPPIWSFYLSPPTTISPFELPIHNKLPQGHCDIVNLNDLHT